MSKAVSIRNSSFNKVPISKANHNCRICRQVIILKMNPEQPSLVNDSSPSYDLHAFNSKIATSVLIDGTATSSDHFHQQQQP